MVKVKLYRVYRVRGPQYIVVKVKALTSVVKVKFVEHQMPEILVPNLLGLKHYDPGFDPGLPRIWISFDHLSTATVPNIT